mgnify:CR=1 FL=1
MKIAAALFAVLALTLTGCEEHRIHGGVVVDKSMTRPYPSVIRTGKVTTVLWHPATYRLCLKDSGTIETFYVEADVYASVTVGDSIRFNNE